MMWMWILACKGEDPEDGPTIDCAVQPDNALRVDCPVPASATSLVYTDPDGEPVTRALSGETTVTLWALRAETTYAVEVLDGDDTLGGTFTTGALPDALGALQIEVTGESTVDAFVQEATCAGVAYVLVVDADGVVRWYQDVGSEGSEGAGPGGGDVFGLSVTPTDSVLVLIDGGIREWSFTGAPGLVVDTGPADLRIHHDVVRAGDDTLGLFDEPITGPDGLVYLLDGIAVFDAEGALVDTWHLADHVDPALLPTGGGPPSGMGPPPGVEGPVDWSHGNAITVAEDGSWVVSFRWLSSVYVVDGNRGSPTFGEVLGIVVGDPASPIPPMYPVEGGFVGQHHATLADDRLTLFDNRRPPETSRTVTLEFDPYAGIVRTVETHDLGEPCAVEGGAFPLADGGVFATCATSGIGREFAAGGGDVPRFTLQARCPAPEGDGGEGRLPPVGRIVPIDLP